MTQEKLERINALARLQKEAAFEIWAPLDDGRTAVRFVTSWATRPEDVDALIALL